MSTVRFDEQLALVMLKDSEPGFYTLTFAVRLHDDGGVEVLAHAPPMRLPADDISALIGFGFYLSNSC